MVAKNETSSSESSDLCKELLLTLIPADKLLESVQTELKTCLNDYRQQMKSQWRQGLYGMDQQFTANENSKVEKATTSSTKKISITASCPKKSLVLYHGFETAGEPVPFKGTKFEIHEVTWDDSWTAKVKAAFLKARMDDGEALISEEQGEDYSTEKGDRSLGEAIKITSSGDIKNKLNPSSPNQLDDNGMAEIEGLDGTKEYIVIFEPQITEEDFNTLYASYDVIIQKLSGILTTFWNKPDPETLNKTQKVQYEEFYTSVVNGTYTGSDAGENLSALMKGLLEGLYALWCGLRDVALWVTNPIKQVEVINKLVSNPEAIKAQLEKTGKSLDNILSIFKDEALMFIVIKSVMCYFQLLTPQQCHILLSNGFGQALPQIIITIFLPEAKVDLLLDGLSTIGFTEKNQKEFKDMRDALKNSGGQANGQW